MKIAMLGHKRIPSREGGVEIVVGQLAARMAQKGHDVTVFNRKGQHVSGGVQDRAVAGEKTFYWQGVRVIPVFTLEKKSLNAIVYSFFAAWRAALGPYETVHFHAEGPCSMIWLPRLFGKRVVATIHGLDWQRAKWGGFATRFLKFGEKMAAKYAHEIIVLSAGVQRYFMDTYRRQTVYIPNGVERPCKRPAEEITQKWGLKKDDYLLFLARLVPEKGLHYLLEAYAGLDTDKKLVIAGGASHSADYEAQIAALAAKDPRVIRTGFVQGTLLEELYSNAYLYVLPSDIEGMPLSLLEAMSYGNCCLVSDIPENQDVIGSCGFTFQKADVQDLQKKLKDLLENSEKVGQKKETAADFVCHKYDWNEITEKTLELYQKK